MTIYDDYLYLSLLVGSIIFGKLIRILKPCNLIYRKWLSSFFGIFIILIVCGYHVFVVFILIIAQIAIIFCVNPRYNHVSSFVFGFSYLCFTRLLGSFGFPEIPPHANAIVMIMTLKLIGLAFEYHDFITCSTASLEVKAILQIHPTALNIFHYACTHAGLLTGPYYKYRTFEDFYNFDYSLRVDCDSIVWKKIRYVPLYLAGFLVLRHFFSIEDLQEENFYATTSLVYRVFVMSPIFVVQRLRYYVAFVLSECSCISAGLGAYPSEAEAKSGQGPTPPALRKLNEKIKRYGDDDLYDFETIHNIDIYKSETALTMREAFRSWNMTIQFWLVFNVYKRLRGFLNMFMSTTAVMLVSSVWHGVHPGYYLSMGSIPLMLLVEDSMQKNIRRKITTSWILSAYDVVSWFIRVQWFSYLSMGFFLLQIDFTLKFWSSVYYIGHLSLPILYLISLYFKSNTLSSS